jgi:hypothetical protein
MGPVPGPEQVRLGVAVQPGRWLPWCWLDDHLRRAQRSHQPAQGGSGVPGGRRGQGALGPASGQPLRIALVVDQDGATVVLGRGQQRAQVGGPQERQVRRQHRYPAAASGRVTQLAQPAAQRRERPGPGRVFPREAHGQACVLRPDDDDPARPGPRGGRDDRGQQRAAAHLQAGLVDAAEPRGPATREDDRAEVRPGASRHGSAADGRHRAVRLQEGQVVDAVAGQLARHRPAPADG